VCGHRVDQEGWIAVVDAVEERREIKGHGTTRTTRSRFPVLSALFVFMFLVFTFDVLRFHVTERRT
jgi:hypothetical protein